MQSGVILYRKNFKDINSHFVVQSVCSVRQLFGVAYVLGSKFTEPLAVCSWNTNDTHITTAACTVADTAALPFCTTVQNCIFCQSHVHRKCRTFWGHKPQWGLAVTSTKRLGTLATLRVICHCSDVEAEQLKASDNDEDDVVVVYPKTKSTSRDQFIIPKNTLTAIKSRQ